MVAFMMTVLLGFVGLAIDSGRAFTARRRQIRDRAKLGDCSVRRGEALRRQHPDLHPTRLRWLCHPSAYDLAGRSAGHDQLHPLRRDGSDLHRYRSGTNRADFQSKRPAQPDAGVHPGTRALTQDHGQGGQRCNRQRRLPLPHSRSLEHLLSKRRRRDAVAARILRVLPSPHPGRRGRRRWLLQQCARLRQLSDSKRGEPDRQLPVLAERAGSALRAREHGRRAPPGRRQPGLSGRCRPRLPGAVRSGLPPGQPDHDREAPAGHLQLQPQLRRRLLLPHPGSVHVAERADPERRLRQQRAQAPRRSGRAVLEYQRRQVRRRLLAHAGRGLVQRRNLGSRADEPAQ
ncbi:MAG: hypothetical protein E6J02_07740 [Chloroflexi bacterium]|nr:MAG: hypothetical protein E6J02_07740 [Chloroflexota bacterium]